MLNPEIVKKFLNRELDSFDWLKKESVDSINSCISELNPVPQLGTAWLHQKVCFLLIEALKRFMIYLDMGGGKTALSLSVIRYRKQCGEKPKAIVFVPYITAVETWIEETAKHTPELNCVPLLGTTKENLISLTKEGDLFVICYQSAVAMLSESTPSKKKNKKKWSINSKNVRETFKSFNILIMDEIHKCKSHTSLTYKMCRAISSQCEYVIGLTGTPFGKDLQDLWPQFNLIDFGETLGDTLGLYRAAFFKEKMGYFGGREYKFQKRLFNQLKRMVKNRSIRYEVEEFYDMPPKEYIHKGIEPSSVMLPYIEQSVGKLNELVRGGKEYRAIESEYLRLCQLSSGFMTLKGEDDDKIQLKFDDNPKLDALQELIEAMPEGHKMVVFHHFIYTNELISERLNSLKVPHARIYGKIKDPISQLRQFKTDVKCRVLILNSKSGSSSLNLQIANYAVFFEEPMSVIDRQQAEGRIWRPGQERRSFIYDLIMKKTWDDKRHKSNADGKNLLHELLDGKI